MFCQYCGASINDDAAFCPACGKKIINPNNNSLKDKLSKASEVINDSVKNAGGKINDATDGKLDDVIGKANEGIKSLGASVDSATNGQASQYANKAKETIDDYTKDLKETIKTKDTKNFFTKNKYRNSIISAAIIILIFVLGNLMFGNDGAKWLSKVPTVSSRDVGLYGYTEIDKDDIEGPKNYSTLGKHDECGMNDEASYFIVRQKSLYTGIDHNDTVVQYFFISQSVGLDEFFANNDYLRLEIPDCEYDLCVARASDLHMYYGAFVKPNNTDYAKSRVKVSIRIKDTKYNDYFSGKKEVKILSDKDIEKRRQIEEQEAEKKREEEEARAQAEYEAYMAAFQIGVPAYSEKLKTSITVKEVSTELITLSFPGIGKEYKYEIKQCNKLGDGGYSCQLVSGFDPENVSGYGGSGLVTFYNDHIDCSEFEYPDLFRDALNENPDILPMDYQTGNVFYYSGIGSTSEGTSEVTVEYADDEEMLDEIDHPGRLYGYWEDDGTCYTVAFDFDGLNNWFSVSITHGTGPATFLEGSYADNNDGTKTATINIDINGNLEGKTFTIIEKESKAEIKSDDESLQIIAGEYPYVGDDYLEFEKMKP